MATVRQLIQARIDDQCDFKEVAGASSLEALLKSRISDEGCYVLPSDNRAGGNNLINGVSQRCIETYAIVVVTRNVAGERYSDGADQNEAKRDEVTAALLGWQPNEHAEPMEYVNGRLVRMLDGFLIWQELYRTARRRRAV